MYTGNNQANNTDKFDPQDVMVTPRDNIIICDTNNDALHILNMDGCEIKTIRMGSIVFLQPVAIYLYSPGVLVVGTAIKSQATICTLKYKGI